MRKLEVGDIIIGQAYGKYSIYTIRRVTKTLAVSTGGQRFKRPLFNEMGVRLYGAGMYSAWSYSIATPKTLEAQKKYAMTMYIKGTNIKALDLKEIEKIYNLIKEVKL